MQGSAVPARRGLAKLQTLLDSVRERPRAPVGPLLDVLADVSGYRAALSASDDELEQTRVANIDELIAHAHTLDRRESGFSLAAFLESTALVSDQDGVVEGEPDGGRVLLMSAHAAKGLEFPCVLVAGAEHGYFPHARSVDEDGRAEEERRLFYVAMTRAEDELVISLAHTRITYRGMEPRSPSPYLNDMPRAAVHIAQQDVSGAGHDWPEHGVHDQPDRVQEHAAAPMSRTADSHPVDGPIARVGEAFRQGEAVRHPYFGLGEVQSSSGRGSNARVVVAFVEHGTRTLLLSHARLEREDA